MLILTKLRKYIYNYYDQITYLFDSTNGNLDKTITTINTNEVGFIIDYTYTGNATIWTKTRVYKNKNKELTIQTKPTDKKYLSINIYNFDVKILGFLILKANTFYFECNDPVILNLLLGISKN